MWCTYHHTPQFRKILKTVSFIPLQKGSHLVQRMSRTRTILSLWCVGWEFQSWHFLVKAHPIGKEALSNRGWTTHFELKLMIQYLLVAFVPIQIRLKNQTYPHRHRNLVPRAKNLDHQFQPQQKSLSSWFHLLPLQFHPRRIEELSGKSSCIIVDHSKWYWVNGFPNMNQLSLKQNNQTWSNSVKHHITPNRLAHSLPRLQFWKILTRCLPKLKLAKSRIELKCSGSCGCNQKSQVVESELGLSRSRKLLAQK